MIHNQKGQLVIHCSLHQKDYIGDIKITKVTDYKEIITFSLVMGHIGMESCLSVQEASLAVGMLSPWLPGT